MSDKSKPAFPSDMPYDAALKHNVPTGMTLREYTVIKLASAWVFALYQRNGQHGYTEEYCAYEANRLAIEQADALIAELQRGDR